MRILQTDPDLPAARIKIGHIEYLRCADFLRAVDDAGVRGGLVSLFREENPDIKFHKVERNDGPPWGWYIARRGALKFLAFIGSTDKQELARSRGQRMGAFAKAKVTRGQLDAALVEIETLRNANAALAARVERLSKAVFKQQDIIRAFEAAAHKPKIKIRVPARRSVTP